MAETTTSERKRRFGSSVPNSLSNEDEPGKADGKLNGASETVDEEVEILLPIRKKAKTTAPRPLRLLKPNLPLQYIPSSDSDASHLLALRYPADQPNHEHTTHHEEHAIRGAHFTLASTSQPLAHETMNCSYCKMSIEGGVAGLRRHQTGKTHVLNVLRGILKYIAPHLLPATMWNFPAQISFNIQDQDFLAYFNDQISQCESFDANGPSSTFNDSYMTSAAPKKTFKLDCDLLMYLMVVESKNVGHILDTVESVYLKQCRLMNMFPLDKSRRICPFCDIQDAYSVLKPKVAPIPSSSSLLDPVPSSPPSTSHTTYEDSLMQFWRHLSSDSHRNIVGKFWREHHVSHPSLFANRYVSSPNDSHTTFKRSKSAVEKRNDSLALVPLEWFDASSYMLSQSQLQRILECWSRLKKLVSLVPKPLNVIATESQDLSSALFLPLHPIPLPLPSSFSSQIVGEPLKDQILRFMKSGREAKQQGLERVGAKWASAVKAFLASHPGMTTRQLIQLVRLERAANPNQNESRGVWYPNFGGVWNETTRANHARNFIGSQRHH